MVFTVISRLSIATSEREDLYRDDKILRPRVRGMTLPECVCDAAWRVICIFDWSPQSPLSSQLHPLQRITGFMYTP